jgi:hypothetical protein
MSAEYKLWLLTEESSFGLYSGGKQSQARNCSISFKKYSVLRWSHVVCIQVNGIIFCCSTCLQLWLNLTLVLLSSEYLRNDD